MKDSDLGWLFANILVPTLRKNAISVLSQNSSKDCSSYVNFWYKKILSSSTSYKFPEINFKLSINFLNIEIPFLWDIEKLLHEKNDLPIRELNVSELFNYIPQESLKDITGPSFSTGPIILAEVPFSRPDFYVIDGNHRVLNALRKQQKKLPSRIYLTKDHLPFMEPYTRLVFLFCCNIMLLSMWTNGMITQEELNFYLFPIE